MKELGVFSFPSDYEWLSPWTPVTNDYIPLRTDENTKVSPFRILNDELHREMPPRHLLYGLTTAAVAVCIASHKDILFVTDDARQPIALVHLTWTMEKDPAWPSTTAFSRLEDWNLEMVDWAKRLPRNVTLRQRLRQK